MIFFLKIFFYIKRPRVIFLFEENKLVFDFLNKILKNEFKIAEISFNSINPFIIFKKDILIFKINYISFKKIKFFIKKSSNPIIVFNNISDKEFNVFDFLKFLPSSSKIITDIDSIKKIRKEKLSDDLTIISVGFDDRADFKATDLNIGDGNNFKIIYSGDVIPFWTKNQLNEKEMEKIIIAIAIGMFSGKNLIKISQIIQEVI